MADTGPHSEMETLSLRHGSVAAEAHSCTILHQYKSQTRRSCFRGEFKRYLSTYGVRLARLSNYPDVCKAIRSPGGMADPRRGCCGRWM